MTAWCTRMMEGSEGTASGCAATHRKSAAMYLGEGGHGAGAGSGAGGKGGGSKGQLDGAAVWWCRSGAMPMVLTAAHQAKAVVTRSAST